MPLLKPQATQNLQAEMMIRATAANQDISEELVLSQHAFENPHSESGLFGMLYNPAGHLVLAIASPAYAAYPPRVSDVEGVRRAAVLAAQLRARSVDAQSVSAALRSSASQSPYAGEAFEWDDTEHSIVFVGKGTRGRHTIKY